MLRPLFEWFDGLSLSVAIRNSRVLFPIIESIHILALAVLLGSVLLFSLRLLGMGLKQRAVPDVYRTLAGMRNWSFAIMLATGFLLFCSEAIKCYESPPFIAKMITLAVAAAFQYGVVRRVALAGHASLLGSALTAILSLVLWFGVGVAGRAIGFY